MKHSGRARQAALKADTVDADCAGRSVCHWRGGESGQRMVVAIISGFLVVVWVVFVVFTVYFFRDPNARVPAEPNLIVSVGHGKVDVIDQVTEPLFMGGPCQRISTFLSVFDVHVQ